LLAEFDIVATVGNARDFKNGRQFATWLGLTSRQFSTDGKSALGKITKHSDVYLRTLLIHGARSELMHVHDRIIVAMLAKESEVLGPDPASEAGDTSDYVQAA
jgi:transposase